MGLAERGLALADDNDLIAAIYDCIIDPSRWDEVVNRIVKSTKSVSGALITQKLDAAQSAALCNVDPFYADAYAQHYCKFDPFGASAAALAPGEVRSGTFLTQTDAFRASVFYNEFFRPQGWAEAVALGLFRTPTARGFFTFQRSPDSICMEPAEWHLLQTIAPHLARAAAIHQLLSQARVTTDSLGEAARLAKRDTRAYARRQLTFARHQLGSFRWATPEEAERSVLAASAP
jgi:hypothetical protein